VKYNIGKIAVLDLCDTHDPPVEFAIDEIASAENGSAEITLLEGTAVKLPGGNLLSGKIQAGECL
jgi:hypothetical protein